MYFNTCECRNKYKLTAENCIVNTYTQCRYMTFVLATCEKCGDTETLFIRDPKMLEYFLSGEFPINEGVWPKDSTIRAFERVYGLEQVPTFEITPRHERYIAFLRYLLSRSRSVEDLLSSSTDTKTPGRWH